MLLIGMFLLLLANSRSDSLSHHMQMRMHPGTRKKDGWVDVPLSAWDEPDTKEQLDFAKGENLILSAVAPATFTLGLQCNLLQ